MDPLHRTPETMTEQHTENIRRKKDVRRIQTKGKHTKIR